MKSSDIASCILNLVARWRWMASFTSRSLYPRYPLDRSLDGHQSRSSQMMIILTTIPLWLLPLARSQHETDSNPCLAHIVTDLYWSVASRIGNWLFLTRTTPPPPNWSHEPFPRYARCISLTNTGTYGLVLCSVWYQRKLVSGRPSAVSTKEIIRHHLKTPLDLLISYMENQVTFHLNSRRDLRSSRLECYELLTLDCVIGIEQKTKKYTDTLTGVAVRDIKASEVWQTVLKRIMFQYQPIWWQQTTNEHRTSESFTFFDRLPFWVGDMKLILPSPRPPTAILFSVYDLDWTRTPTFRLCDPSVLVHGVTPSLRWYWYSLFNETKADCGVALLSVINCVYVKVFKNSFMSNFMMEMAWALLQRSVKLLC
jgi:hypothetical protein